jgi:hypothetical protein
MKNLISSVGPGGATPGFLLWSGGRVVDLCIKHDTELVLEALDREGTTLDDFLATA